MHKTNARRDTTFLHSAFLCEIRRCKIQCFCPDTMYRQSEQSKTKPLCFYGVRMYKHVCDHITCMRPCHMYVTMSHVWTMSRYVTMSHERDHVTCSWPFDTEPDLWVLSEQISRGRLVWKQRAHGLSTPCTNVTHGYSLLHNNWYAISPGQKDVGPEGYLFLNTLFKWKYL